MYRLEITKEQLSLIQKALDLYSRIGIGQLTEIKEHPTFEKILHNKCKTEGKVDWEKYHQVRDNADKILTEGRNRLIQRHDLGVNGSFGIFAEQVDDSCRVAFDILQVIRHRFWKESANKSYITVDSSIHFSHRKDSSSHKIKLEKVTKSK